MKHVSATEAKARFSELLSDVERGEKVQITRHGKVVATLVPQNGDESASGRQAAVEAVRAFMRHKPSQRVSVADILEMRDEGRRV
ncbi:type II toxin-antitoxin system Phd/YefM family antitoxin [Minwuia sp.]|uniref:type II toxin-antitoxin system Phd/YefM family antitoxin n=1 Tax=Minwuia sp. TaxID=2493630 RepID=UPI003A8F2214